MFIKQFILSGFLCFASLITLAAQDSNATSQEMTIKTPAKGTVALTFDDGPNPDFTPKILEVLKKYNLKATFFEVGMQVKTYPEITKQVDAAGMAVASHSQTHPMLTKVGEAQLENEVAAPSAIIFNTIGKKPVCLRYPFGASNQHVRDVIREHGMAPVAMGWNSFDYNQPGVDKIVAQVVNNAHSGTVILLHDGFAGLNRQQTLDALPLIIEGIKKKGLGFSQICVDSFPPKG